MRRRSVAAFIGGMALVLCSVQFAAAQSFPNHPVKIVVGPSPDIFSRIVAERLQQVWGQAVSRETPMESRAR